jgi:hypothetical protein
MADDRGAPIAYMVLQEGTPVHAADGVRVGTVKRVLADTGIDMFDGLVLDTDEGERFVDAPEVGELYERLVVLTIRSDKARELPEHSPAPAVVDVDSDDISGVEGQSKSAARRLWDRLSGNY